MSGMRLLLLWTFVAAVSAREEANLSATEERPVSFEFPPPDLAVAVSPCSECGLTCARKAQKVNDTEWEYVDRCTSLLDLIQPNFMTAPISSRRRKYHLSFIISKSMANYQTWTLLGDVRNQILDLLRKHDNLQEWDIEILMSAITFHFNKDAAVYQASHVFPETTTTADPFFPGKAIQQLMEQEKDDDEPPTHILSVQPAIHLALEEVLQRYPGHECVIVYLGMTASTLHVDGDYVRELSRRGCLTFSILDLGFTGNDWISSQGGNNETIYPLRMRFDLMASLTSTWILYETVLPTYPGGLIFNYSDIDLGTTAGEPAAALRSTRIRFLMADMIAQTAIQRISFPLAQSVCCRKHKNSLPYEFMDCCRNQFRVQDPSDLVAGTTLVYDPRRRRNRYIEPDALADFAIVIDESLISFRRQLPVLLTSLEAALVKLRFSALRWNPSNEQRNLFAIVTFGGGESVLARSVTVTRYLYTCEVFYPIERIMLALAKLPLTRGPAEHVAADGYAGILHAIVNLPWRKNAVRNLVFMSSNTWYQSDGSGGMTPDTLSALLLEHNIVPHFLVDNRFFAYATAKQFRPIAGTDSKMLVQLLDESARTRYYSVDPGNITSVYRDYVAVAIRAEGTAWDLQMLLTRPTETIEYLSKSVLAPVIHGVYEKMTRGQCRQCGNDCDYCPEVCEAYSDQDICKRRARSDFDITQGDFLRNPSRFDSYKTTLTCNDLTIGTAGQLEISGLSAANVYIVLEPSVMNTSGNALARWIPSLIANLNSEMNRKNIGDQVQSGWKYVNQFYIVQFNDNDTPTLVPNIDETEVTQKLPYLEVLLASGSINSSMRRHEPGPVSSVNFLDKALELVSGAKQRVAHTLVVYVSDSSRIAAELTPAIEDTISAHSDLNAQVHFVVPFSDDISTVRGNVFGFNNNGEVFSFSEDTRKAYNETQCAAEYCELAVAARSTVWNSAFFQEPVVRYGSRFTQDLAIGVVKTLVKTRPSSLCAIGHCRRQNNTCDAGVHVEFVLNEECFQLQEYKDHQILSKPRDKDRQILPFPEYKEHQSSSGVNTYPSSEQVNCSPVQNSSTYLEPVKKRTADVHVVLEDYRHHPIWLSDLLRHLNTALVSNGFGEHTSKDRLLQNSFAISAFSGGLHSSNRSGRYGKSLTYNCSHQVPIQHVSAILNDTVKARQSSATEQNMFSLNEFAQDFPSSSHKESHQITIVVTKLLGFLCPFFYNKVSLSPLIYLDANITENRNETLFNLTRRCFPPGFEDAADVFAATLNNSLLDYFGDFQDNISVMTLKSAAEVISRRAVDKADHRYVCQQCQCMDCNTTEATMKCDRVVSEECDQKGRLHSLVGSVRIPGTCNSSTTDFLTNQALAERLPPMKNVTVSPGNQNASSTTAEVPSTPTTSLTPALPEALLSTTTMVVVLAVASAVVLAVLLTAAIVACGVRRRRKRRHDLKITADLETMPSFRPPPSIAEASRYMLATMAIPAGSALKIIPPRSLSFLRQIGSGQFGEVHVGRLRLKDRKHGGVATNDLVAIKLMKGQGDSEVHGQLLQEYFLQESVGDHPNIVKVILGGLYNAEPCIVMEYMANGDLLNFLRNIKGAHKLMASGENHPFMQSVEKLDIARQVSLGLEFLASKKFVHRDIAARNMLVRESAGMEGKLEVKISDWGLSRKAVMDGAYQTQTTRKLPLKWMAIESIETGYFTEKTDVWSFGVLLWEIETCGNVPFADTPNALILQLLQNGRRLERPSQCSETMHVLMERCWDTEPEKRPTFANISKELTSELENEADYITVVGGEASSPQVNQLRRPSALLTVLQQVRLERDAAPDADQCSLDVDSEYMDMSPSDERRDRDVKHDDVKSTGSVASPTREDSFDTRYVPQPSSMLSPPSDNPTHIPPPAIVVESAP